MNITLKQADIEKAVRLYIERQGFHLLNKTLSIDFSMGRGDNGLSAILTIEDATVIPGFTDQVGQTDGPSAAVQALAAAVSLPATEAKVSGTTAKKADQVILPGGGEIKAAPAVVVAEPDPIAVVAEVVEVAKVAPATLAEVAEAGIAVAAVATQETEAAKAAPVAEANVAEAAPAPAAEAQAKPTTSLFG